MQAELLEAAEIKPWGCGGLERAQKKAAREDSVWVAAVVGTELAGRWTRGAFHWMLWTRSQLV